MAKTAPLGIPQVLWDVLACPCAAHGSLTVDGEQLVCSACASRFEVRDGVPVMLLAED